MTDFKKFTLGDVVAFFDASLSPPGPYLSTLLYIDGDGLADLSALGKRERFVPFSDTAILRYWNDSNVKFVEPDPEPDDRNADVVEAAPVAVAPAPAQEAAPAAQEAAPAPTPQPIDQPQPTEEPPLTTPVGAMASTPQAAEPVVEAPPVEQPATQADTASAETPPGG